MNIGCDTGKSSLLHTQDNRSHPYMSLLVSRSMYSVSHHPMRFQSVDVSVRVVTVVHDAQLMTISRALDGVVVGLTQ